MAIRKKQQMCFNIYYVLLCRFLRFSSCVLFRLLHTDMGTKNIILNALKKYIAIGLVGITVTDRYAGVCPVRGSSMSPTFNPSLGSFTGSFRRAKNIYVVYMNRDVRVAR